MSDDLKKLLELLKDFSYDENLDNFIIDLDVWKEFLIYINKLKNTEEFKSFFNNER